MPSVCPTCSRPMRPALRGVIDALGEVSLWVLCGIGFFHVITYLA